MADARLFAKTALQQPHQGVKIAGERRLRELFDQRICRMPIRIGHRMISFLCWVAITVSVKEFKETYLAKNCSSTAPPDKNAQPGKGGFVEQDRDFQTAGKRDGPRNGNPPEHRLVAHVANAINLFEQVPVVGVGIQLENLPQPLGTRFGSRVL